MWLSRCVKTCSLHSFTEEVIILKGWDESVNILFWIDVFTPYTIFGLLPSLFNFFLTLFWVSVQLLTLHKISVIIKSLLTFIHVCLVHLNWNHVREIPKRANGWAFDQVYNPPVALWKALRKQCYMRSSPCRILTSAGVTDGSAAYSHSPDPLPKHSHWSQASDTELTPISLFVCAFVKMLSLLCVSVYTFLLLLVYWFMWTLTCGWFVSKCFCFTSLHLNLS